MVQRLATEYVKACLTIDGSQMAEVLQMFRSQSLHQVGCWTTATGKSCLKMTEGKMCHLRLNGKPAKSMLGGSCRITNPQLTNVLRKLYPLWGDAWSTGFIRILRCCTNTAEAPSQILERPRRVRPVVYELRDSSGELERRFETTAWRRKSSDCTFRLMSCSTCATNRAIATAKMHIDRIGHGLAHACLSWKHKRASLGPPCSSRAAFFAANGAAFHLMICAVGRFPKKKYCISRRMMLFLISLKQYRNQDSLRKECCERLFPREVNDVGPSG